MFNMSYEHHEQPVSALCAAAQFVHELAMWTRWRLFVPLFVLTRAFTMPLWQPIYFGDNNDYSDSSTGLGDVDDDNTLIA